MQKNHKPSIEIVYIYSACIITKTPDLTILHDPWFTEGIYDGSWYHYPKVKNPLNSIGNVDIIYISHIHPDHYDPQFLKHYFSSYGQKEIIIANHNPNHLASKMRADGFSPTVLESPYSVNNTSITIMPHITGSHSNIDSALILKYQAPDKLHCIVNANDVIFNDNSRNLLKSLSDEVDVLLCGFTGAGPYPQTYFDPDSSDLDEACTQKKKNFFQRYKSLTEHINAKVNIPFAGKYILGGKLASLNHLRGIADPVEVTAFDSRAVVLSDNGGYINTADLTPHGVRQQPYDPDSVAARIQEIADIKMDYERLIPKEEVHQLPLKRLLIKAYKNALYYSECTQDYYFCIHLPENEICVVNANKNSAPSTLYFTNNTEALPEPRSAIHIDYRYLFGLLTHIYHWNNAEVGSQYMTRRAPNEFNRAAQKFLNYLCV